VITSATEVGNIRPSGGRTESVAKIHEVGFYCLTSATWDDPTFAYDTTSSPTFAERADDLLRDAYRDSGTSTPNPQVYEHPCMPLQKIIGTGTFYYALQPHWDLSSRLSQRLNRDSMATKDIAIYDERFVWNEYMIRSLLDFRERLEPQERDDLDLSQFIVGAVAPGLIVMLNWVILGSCYTRLRWCLSIAIASPTYKWFSNDRNHIAYI
jgi:synaptojanin